MEIMYNATVPNSLFPTQWDVELGIPVNGKSVSAQRSVKG